MKDSMKNSNDHSNPSSEDGDCNEEEQGREEEPLVIRDLRQHLHGPTSPQSSASSSSPSSPSSFSSTSSLDFSVSLPVAAIKTLLDVIRRTSSETMMGVQMELRGATELMIGYASGKTGRKGKGDSSVTTTVYSLTGGRSHIALVSGCELFMKYITRCFLELPDFKSCKAQILQRGERFATISQTARDRIASSGSPFIRPNSVILTHGWSRVVSSLLEKAHCQHQVNFDLIVLEGRPDAGGARAAANVYAKMGIPTTVVLDSAMAYVMEKVDMVLVGAEGVVENGGIVNKIGTYGLAIAAKEMGKPFYVAAESFKFARLYPLNQADLSSEMDDDGIDGSCGLGFVDTVCWEATGGMVGNPKKRGNGDSEFNDEEKVTITSPLATKGDETVGMPGLVKLPREVRVENPSCDYTPAKYITLLFTDLGVLTPSAVSDELIRLYQ